HPDIELSLVEAEPPESIDLVRTGECDLTLTFDYPGQEDDANGLHRVTLLSDPLIEVISPRLGC
ncbi:MAG: LysR substrate-binding domain-containing protein, partial [Candidatus Dormibacteria bacterium]